MPRKLAEQGFVTLSLDLSFWGESEGQPRNAVSPDIYAEDFSAAVDFLRTQSFVDRDRIGAIGICGSGSFVISAAKIDPRIQAIATVSMYDMGAANRNGLGHAVTRGAAQGGHRRGSRAARRGVRRRPDRSTPAASVHSIDERSSPIEREFYDFYRTPRGEFTPAGSSPQLTTHPTLTSNVKFMNFYPFTDIETISPRPMLFITGETAHSREFSEDGLPPGRPAQGAAGRARRRATSTSTTGWTLIPFDSLTAFFTTHLRAREPAKRQPTAGRRLFRPPSRHVHACLRSPACHHRPRRCADPADWGGVLAMTLCVFALIASEFMPVSLLTPIAADLRVSEGQAGHGIAMSGAFAVVTSLLMRRGRPHGPQGAAACADGADVRVRRGLALAAQLRHVHARARADRRGHRWVLVDVGGHRHAPGADATRCPRRWRMFNGGNALATVVAAPLGSYLGGIIGWRGAFFCLVPVAVIALAWQWIALPSMRPAPQATARPGALRLLTRPLLALGMLAAGLFFMGQFTLFTYLRPFLEGTTGVAVPTLSLHPAGHRCGRPGRHAAGRTPAQGQPVPGH